MSPDARFEACVAEVLRHEGGYSDNPDDPGGATNRGITLATLRDYRGRAVTKDDVRDLSEAEAKAIYRARYWPQCGDALPAGVDLAVFDFAVNSGPGRAARALQTVLGVAADGAIGPRTLAALARANPRAVAIGVGQNRLEFLRGLTGWGTFGKGWGKRVAQVTDLAAQMAAR